MPNDEDEDDLLSAAKSIQENTGCILKILTVWFFVGVVGAGIGIIVWLRQ